MNRLEYLEDRADELINTINELKHELEDIEDQMAVCWEEERKLELSEYYRAVL